MTAEMAYGALSAKVRALYGKRLRSDDFARLAARRSEAPDELRGGAGVDARLPEGARDDRPPPTQTRSAILAPRVTRELAPIQQRSPISTGDVTRTPETPSFPKAWSWSYTQTFGPSMVWSPTRTDSAATMRAFAFMNTPSPRTARAPGFTWTRQFSLR